MIIGSASNEVVTVAKQRAKAEALIGGDSMHFQHRKYQEASVYAVLPVLPVLTVLTGDLTGDQARLRNGRKKALIHLPKGACNALD